MMNEQDENDCDPLVTAPLTTDEEYHTFSFTAKSEPQNKRTKYLQFGFWFAILELANILLFLVGPVTLARVRDSKSHHLDDCK